MLYGARSYLISVGVWRHIVFSLNGSKRILKLARCIYRNVGILEPFLGPIRLFQALCSFPV